jgi:hypothetical protein
MFVGTLLEYRFYFIIKLRYSGSDLITLVTNAGFRPIANDMKGNGIHQPTSILKVTKTTRIRPITMVLKLLIDEDLQCIQFIVPHFILPLLIVIINYYSKIFMTH